MASAPRICFQSKCERVIIRLFLQRLGKHSNSLEQLTNIFPHLLPWLHVVTVALTEQNEQCNCNPACANRHTDAKRGAQEIHLIPAVLTKLKVFFGSPKTCRTSTTRVYSSHWECWWLKKRSKVLGATAWRARQSRFLQLNCCSCLLSGKVIPMIQPISTFSAASATSRLGCSSTWSESGSLSWVWHNKRTRRQLGAWVYNLLLHVWTRAADPWTLCFFNTSSTLGIASKQHKCSLRQGAVSW